MSLPNLVTPEHTIQVPSTKKKIKFRPFLVKEEKLLLTALESAENEDILSAIKQVMRNCILTNIDIDSLSFFDFEYIFLMLRSKSVGNTLDLSIMHDCSDPAATTKVLVDLDKINVTFPKDHTAEIMIDETYGVKMKYPTIGNSESYMNMSNENLFDILGDFIEFVYDKENVYDEFTKEEMQQFIESMNKSQLERILSFFNTMPTLEHDLTYKCSKCGDKVTHKLKGLTDFFT